MTYEKIDNDYFNWMFNLICGAVDARQYTKLLEYLYQYPFVAIIPLDENRANDGINLRYRFAQNYGAEREVAADMLDTHECSMLEMMVALALRCEEHIMDDPDYGDRTGQWFWEMICSLGLSGMTNSNFDEDYISEVLERFLERQYSPNGAGGLFTIDKPSRDLRNVEIWYQLHMYLKSVDAMTS